MIRRTTLVLVIACLVSNSLAALAIIDPVVKFTLDIFGKSAYSTLPTLYMSYQLAVECIENNIPGDFVECGVAAGSQVAAMAYAAQTLSVKKKIHLFDSFEGIPLAGAHDTAQPGIVGPIQHNVNVPSEQLLVSSGISVCSLENVQKNMKNWGINPEYFIYHKGWFQHTLPNKANDIDAISFLRLDGDLYESTKVCLEYLYPKISSGGYIVIDDFGSLEGCKKAVLEYLEMFDLHPNIIEIEGGLGPVYWQVE